MIIYLPQRFQIQDGLDPVASGIRMLPLLLMSSFGAGAGGVINSKKNVSFYALMGGVSLQLIGLGLMTSLPTTGTIVAAQYGYQVLLGLGFGVTLTSLVIISRVEVEQTDRGDLAITMGVVTQVRVLGGTIAVSIGQLLLTRNVNKYLGGTLSDAEMNALHESVANISQLTPAKQAAVSDAYGRAFNTQTLLVLYITAACWIFSLATFKRGPLDRKMPPEEVQPRLEGDTDEEELLANSADPAGFIQLVEVDLSTLDCSSLEWPSSGRSSLDLDRLGPSSVDLSTLDLSSLSSTTIGLSLRHF
jgi:hypothetical protein